MEREFHSARDREKKKKKIARRFLNPELFSDFFPYSVQMIHGLRKLSKRSSKLYLYVNIVGFVSLLWFW